MAPAGRAGSYPGQRHSRPAQPGPPRPWPGAAILRRGSDLFYFDRHSFLLFSSVGWRRGTVCSLAVQELADQVLQDHRRLRCSDLVAWRQVLLVGAGFDTDVLLTQQASRQDLQRAVLGEGVAVFQGQGDLGLEGLVVENNRLDTPDHHPRALDRSLGLEPADIVELRSDPVGG